MIRLINFFIAQRLLKSEEKYQAQVIVFTSLLALIGILYATSILFSPINWILISGCLITLTLTYLDKLEWAKYCLLSSGWLTLTLTIYTIEGVRNVNIIAYFFILFLAVYAFPKRVSIAIFVITCLSLVVLAIGQDANLIQPKPSVATSTNILINRLINFSTVFVFMYIRNIWEQRTKELKENREKLLRKSAALAATNKTLQISEARFRELVEHAPEAIVLYDVDKKKFVEVNNKATVLIGLSKEALLDAVPWASILKINPQFNERQQLLLERILMGGLITFETSIRHVNGQQRPVSVQAIRLPDKEKTLLRLSVSDLTVATEREAQIQYQTTLLNQISEAVIALDLDHQITSWNSAAEKIYGWKSSEALGKFVTDIIPTKVIANTALLEEGENDYRLEALQPRKDGSIVHISSAISPQINIDGHLIGTVVTSRDISKRHKVKQALAETTERLNKLINNIPAFVNYIDTDGKTVFLNDFHKSIGLNPAELLGVSYIDLFSPAEQLILKPEIEKALAGERTEFEMFFHTQDTKYFVEMVFVPHTIDEEVNGFFVLGIDRTERLKALEALFDSQKVDSLGILAGGIAHDFNNLLAAIMVQGSIAQLQLSDSSPIQNNLAKLMDTAERAAMLAKQMLAYSGKGHTEIKTINVNAVIQESLRLFYTSIEPKITLTVDYCEPLPVIEADITQIQQVVLNLLLNGSQAIGQRNGNMQIKTGILVVGVDESRIWQYTGESAKEGEYVCLSITDDGEGMEAVTLAKIFDPFFTTKRDGTGLGLAAVLGIVRGHGGGVEVKSAVNYGTTANIYFPALKLPEKELILTPERQTI